MRDNQQTFKEDYRVRTSELQVLAQSGQYKKVMKKHKTQKEKCKNYKMITSWNCWKLEHMLDWNYWNWGVSYF